MVSTPTQIERIIRTLVRALEPDIRVDRVILYGSYAHDRAHEWSDIDVAVLSNDFERMTEIEKAQFMARRTMHCDSPLVPLTYTTIQFDNAEPYQFAAEIKRTGRVVYDARRQRKRKSRVEHKRRVARRPMYRAVQ